MPKTTSPESAPTAVPQVPTSGSEHPHEDAIRARAYEISQGEHAGSPEENWERAIAELHAERVDDSR